jgi:Mg/Co/Ni transporter MgtE
VATGPGIDPLSADFARQFPDAFARILARGVPDEVFAVLKRIPAGSAASIVGRLPPSRVAALLALRGAAPGQWLADASFDDAVTLLGRIPRERCLALVNSLEDREHRQRLLRYLKYPAHSVGALVSDVLVRFSEDMPAADVLAEIRRHESDKPRPLVVQHTDGRYLGVLDAWNLLIREAPAGPIRDFVTLSPRLHPETSLGSALRDPNWHKHSWMPVVDQQDRVLGGVSRKNLFQAADRHAGQSPQGHDLFTDLAAEMVGVLGELLDRLLGRQSSP